MKSLYLTQFDHVGLSSQIKWSFRSFLGPLLLSVFFVSGLSAQFQDCLDCNNVRNDKGDPWSVDCYLNSDCTPQGNICTSNDVRVLGLYLGGSDKGSLPDCTIGDTVEAYLWLVLQANAHRYTVRFYGEHYSGGDLVACHNECVLEEILSGEQQTVLLHHYQWICGEPVTIGNVLAAFNQHDDLDCSMPATCGDYTSSRCYYPGGILEVMVPHFTYACGTAYNQVCFNDATVGGKAPYMYSWDFGDGTTGTGTTVCHTYGSRGAYEVTLTVTDAAGVTVRRTYSVDLGEDGLDCCQLEVTCPPSQDPGVYDCFNPIPAPALTIKGFTDLYGNVIGPNPCGPIAITAVDDPSNFDYCQAGTVKRIYYIGDGYLFEVCEIYFDIQAPPALTIEYPEDVTLQACATQGDIDQAFAQWVSEFSFKGGCNRSCSAMIRHCLPRLSPVSPPCSR